MLQHAEMSGARTSRDWEDTQVVANFLRDRNPFEYGETFCNLANGVQANASVNAQNAKAIGEQVL